MKGKGVFTVVRAVGLIVALGVLAIGPAGPLDAQGPVPGACVLWNRLGSQTEVENSEVGPDGSYLGGGFTEGVFGDAFIANYNEDNKVRFPKEVIFESAGTIEFWAKLTGFPSGLGWNGGGKAWVRLFT